MVQTINGISFYIKITEKMIYKRSTYFRSFFSIWYYREHKKKEVCSARRILSLMKRGSFIHSTATSQPRSRATPSPFHIGIATHLAHFPARNIDQLVQLSILHKLQESRRHLRLMSDGGYCSLTFS